MHFYLSSGVRRFIGRSGLTEVLNGSKEFLEGTLQRYIRRLNTIQKGYINDEATNPIVRTFILKHVPYLMPRKHGKARNLLILPLEFDAGFAHSLCNIILCEISPKYFPVSGKMILATAHLLMRSETRIFLCPSVIPWQLHRPTPFRKLAY